MRGGERCSPLAGRFHGFVPEGGIDADPIQRPPAGLWKAVTRIAASLAADHRRDGGVLRNTMKRSVSDENFVRNQ